MEKKGQMHEERQHLPFKLVFLLLRVNDRLSGCEGQQPPSLHPQYGLGVFL